MSKHSAGKHSKGKHGMNEGPSFVMSNSHMNDFPDVTMTDQDLYEYGEDCEARSESSRNDIGGNPKFDEDSMEEEEIGLDDI